MNPLAYLVRAPSRLVDALMPQNLRDHDAERGSRLVVRVILITLAVCVVMQIRYFVDGAHVLSRLGMVAIALQVLGLVLHRVTGSYRVGGHLHGLALWSLFFGLASQSGGIDSPNLVANVFIVVLAPMLLGRRHGLFWLGAVSLTYVGQFVLTSRGFIQQTLRAEDLPGMRLAELIVCTIAVGLTAYFFAKGEESMRAEIAREKRIIEGVNGDLRIILDNAGQGFLSLDAAGRVTGERSAIIDSWLTGVKSGEPFWNLLRPLDERVAEGFEIGWMQLTDEVLPLELCLDQLPKRVDVAEISLKLEYRVVESRHQRDAKLVVILSDISAELARQEAESRQKDLLEAFERILRDPDGFRTFLKSARRDVREIVSGTLVGPELKRCLHTLKGNSGVVGLSVLARACHEIEDSIESTGSMDPALVRLLEREFATVEARLGHFVAAGPTEVALRQEEYDDFLRALAARKPHQELARMARSWSQTRVDRQLTRLSEYAEQLSERLGKAPLRLELQGAKLRMPEGFGDFWDVVVHVVRNAVDHGIEPAAVREELGKGPGVLTFGASQNDRGYTLEIADDGRGIEWERIRELAKQRGLPAESQQDLLAALLTDGLSTSEAVSEISGRGVGMGSVRKICENLGIRIEAQSTRGAGTTFRFLFPEVPLDQTLGVATITA